MAATETALSGHSNIPSGAYDGAGAGGGFGAALGGVVVAGVVGAGLAGAFEVAAAVAAGAVAAGSPDFAPAALLVGAAPPEAVAGADDVGAAGAVADPDGFAPDAGAPEGVGDPLAEPETPEGLDSAVDAASTPVRVGAAGPVTAAGTGS